MSVRGRREHFQLMAFEWCRRCLGDEHALDPNVRGLRFLEEALELAQAAGVSQRQAQEVLAYVYGRPPGLLLREVGGTLVTLAVLCQVFGVEMRDAGVDELRRCDEMTEKIRERSQAKPKFDGRPKPGCLEYSYDPAADTFRVEGVVYAGAMLRHIGSGDIDRWFKVMQRTDGVVTVYIAGPGARLQWEDMRDGEGDSGKKTQG